LFATELAVGTVAASHVMSRMQGWNPDPFGRFEHRYFSNDNPTTLVRTDGVEGRDHPGVRPEETEERSSPSQGSEAKIVVRPCLYERRERRSLVVILLAVAFVLPLVGWELLVTTPNDRLFGVAAFAVVAAALALLVRTFH
jgi:hypothetical protein